MVDPETPCPGCLKCATNDGLILRVSAGRPTKAHEYVFLLTKSARYYYDADAIREPHDDKAGPPERFGKTGSKGGYDPEKRGQVGQFGVRNSAIATNGIHYNPLGRNRRSVWEIATEAFPEAHFATYPTALVEPCIKAGTSEKGCCPDCGAPWARVVERKDYGSWNDHDKRLEVGNHQDRPAFKGEEFYANYQAPRTTGWRASCAHADRQPVPCTVLDPFAGAGTTLLVADRLDRHGIGIELSPSYATLATRRLTDDCPLFTQLALDAPG